MTEGHGVKYLLFTLSFLQEAGLESFLCDTLACQCGEDKEVSLHLARIVLDPVSLPDKHMDRKKRDSQVSI